MLGHLGLLPAPQRDALATVFGRSAGAAPDRFLVGLATLTLFAEVAEQQPLVCIVDDGQWLDQASAQILGFVARRLLAERVAIVCAARTGARDEFSRGFPGCRSAGSAKAMPVRCCWPTCPAPWTPVYATRSSQKATATRSPCSNCPARGTSPVSRAGSAFPAVSRSLAGSSRAMCGVSSCSLPNTRLLVLTAAAEPLGDRVLLHRAAVALGIDISAAGPAQDGGCLSSADVSSSRTRSSGPPPIAAAAAEDRHRVHRALADATAAETDPDRRAWHRARPAWGPTRKPPSSSNARQTARKLAVVSPQRRHS